MTAPVATQSPSSTLRHRAAWILVLLAWLFVAPLVVSLPWAFVGSETPPTPLLVGWSLLVVAVGVELSRRQLRAGVSCDNRGVRLTGMWSRRQWEWTAIQRVTITLDQRASKGGSQWGVIPTLVLRVGAERVPLRPMAMWTSGFDYRQQFVRRASARTLSTFDGWLAAGHVPVDTAYVAAHAWNEGRLSLGELRDLAALPDQTLQDAAQLSRAEGELVSQVATGVLPVGRTRHPRAGTALVVVGRVLLGLVAGFTILLLAFLALDLATGTTVPVHLVATAPDNHCVVASDADPSQTWTTGCIGNWTTDRYFNVRVGGLSDDPVRPVDLLGIVLVGLILGALAVLPLLVGHRLRGPRPLTTV